MRVCRNSHKLKIPLATTICGEGDFNFVYLASSFFIVAPVWQVIIQAFAYIAMYVLFSKLFKIKEFDFYCSKLKTLIIKKM